MLTEMSKELLLVLKVVKSDTKIIILLILQRFSQNTLHSLSPLHLLMETFRLFITIFSYII